MDKDLIFNEISLYDKPDNEYKAKSILENFAQTCASLKNEGFSKLRVENDFWIYLYFEELVLSDFLKKIPSKTQRSFILSFIRPPYIAEDIKTKADEKFAENNYFFNGNTKVTGLAYAYLLDTISVSLSSNPIWDSTEIKITEQYNNNLSEVTVKNASKPEHTSFHKSWIENNKPVRLRKTTVNPHDKKINLRDDHGKDELLSFSKKIVNCEFVESVVNSLPFNPNERNFIRRIYPNGQIEIVLTDTDQGLGVIIQTTGRNLKETEEIGKILQEKYRRNNNS